MSDDIKLIEVDDNLFLKYNIYEVNEGGIVTKTNKKVFYHELGETLGSLGVHTHMELFPAIARRPLDSDSAVIVDFLKSVYKKAVTYRANVRYEDSDYRMDKKELQSHPFYQNREIISSKDLINDIIVIFEKTDLAETDILMAIDKLRMISKVVPSQSDWALESIKHLKEKLLKNNTTSITPKSEQKVKWWHLITRFNNLRLKSIKKSRDEGKNRQEVAVDIVKAESIAITEPEVLVDIDGNAYKTVKIGDQIWMAENLKVTHFRNGEAIPNITDGEEWIKLLTGACCSYDNKPENAVTYGLLYNWFAVNDSRGLAPAGWHVPSYEEWQKLGEYLGGESIAGGKLKEVGMEHWKSPNIGATDAFGFRALPGGYRYANDGSFSALGSYAYFWSSSESNSDAAWYRSLGYKHSGVRRSSHGKQDGFSVRCVRD